MARKNTEHPENMLDQYCTKCIDDLVLPNIFQRACCRSGFLGSLCFGELQSSRIDLSPELPERRTGYNDLCYPCTDGALKIFILYP